MNFYIAGSLSGPSGSSVASTYSVANCELLFFSPEALLSKRLISETEEAIRSRLKPLLDRAEVSQITANSSAEKRALFTNAKHSFVTIYY